MAKRKRSAGSGSSKARTNSDSPELAQHQSGAEPVPQDEGQSVPKIEADPEMMDSITGDGSPR